MGKGTIGIETERGRSGGRAGAFVAAEVDAGDERALGVLAGIGGAPAFELDGSRLRARFGDPREAMEQALGLRRRAGLERGLRAGVACAPDASPGLAEKLLALAPPGEVVVDEAALAYKGLGYRHLVGTDAPAAWALSWARSEDQREHDIALPGRAALVAEQAPGLIGREPELAAVEAAWRKVAAGAQMTVLVEGEAGIGKTRLAAECAREVHRAGGLVMWGRCRESFPIPNQLLSETIRQIQPERETPSSRAVIARTSKLGETVPLATSSADLGELMEASVRALRDGSHDAPLLLVIEDLHAADDVSLETVRFAAASPEPIRMLTICTYRPKDGEAGRLAHSLALLQAEPGIVSLRLEGLSRSDSTTLANAVTAAADGGDGGVADEVVASAAGNPLFLVELARGAATGAGPTAALDEAIGAHVGTLEPEVRELLELAAVAGGEVDVATLAPALDASVEQVEERISAAVRAGLVEQHPRRPRFELSHELIARWLYNGLGAAARGRAHRALAEALEQRLEAGVAVAAAELATHWSRALPEEAARLMFWAERAGDEALAAFDGAAAAVWYADALELCQGFGTDQALECRLMIALGHAQRYRGSGASRRMLIEAAHLASRCGEIDQLVRAALTNQRGSPSSIGGVDDAAVGVLRQAEQALRERSAPGDERLLARVLALLAMELTFAGDYEGRMAICDEALELARACGDERVLADVLVARFIPSWVPANLSERLRFCDEAVAAAARSGDHFLGIQAAHWRFVARVEAGRLALGREDHARETELAKELHDATATWVAAFGDAGLAILEGRLADAERQAQGALELATAAEQPDAAVLYANHMMCVRFEQGRMAEVLPMLASAVEQNPGVPGFVAPLAAALIDDGKPEEATKHLEREVEREFSSLPLDLTWLIGMTIWAHVAANLGHRAAAEMLRSRLAPFEDQLTFTAVSCWGLVGHAVGRLDLCLGDDGKGIERLRGVRDRYAELGMPIWHARAGAHLAGGLNAREAAGDRAEAVAIATGAKLEAERYGAAKVARVAAAAIGDRGGAALEEEVAARVRAAGLSERELDVLRAAAAGGTNAAIGAELQISPKTVKRHLERIYDKVGVRTRAGAVGRIFGA